MVDSSVNGLANAQLEHRTAAEFAPDLDLGRMFNAGDGRGRLSYWQPTQGRFDGSKDNTARIAAHFTTPCFAYVFLRPVNASWREAKGGAPAIFPSISLSFSV